MPIDASIPLGIKPPDQMQSLSSMLGVANGAQNLQLSKQAVQTGGIALQEKQNLQQFMSDKSNYTDADGNVDFNKAMSGVMANAPTTGLPVVQNLLTAQKQHVEATSALNQLGDENRTRVANTLATIPPDADPKVVHQSLDALGQAYKGKLDPWISLAKQGYDQAAPNGTGAVADYFAKATRSVLPQQTQQAMNTPSVMQIDNGANLAGYNLKPNVAGFPQGGQVFSMPKQIGPGERNSTLTDSQGNIHVEHKDANGNVIGTTPLQSAPAAPGAAPAPGPYTIPPGENADTMKSAQAVRTMANQAASTVPQQQFNANQIIKLADETDLGKGASIAANLQGAIPGLHWTSDKATNYNQIGHYLALQTAQLAQSSGLGGTDAAHGIAAEQAGVREWTPDALKKTTRVNRALSTGADLFNRGVENAIQTSGSVIGARKFQNEWSKVADVDALRAYDAYKNRQDDPQGWQATVQEFGGPQSKKFQTTMQKVDAMRALVRGQ